MLFYHEKVGPEYWPDECVGNPDLIIPSVFYVPTIRATASSHRVALVFLIECAPGNLFSFRFRKLAGKPKSNRDRMMFMIDFHFVCSMKMTIWFRFWEMFM